VSHPGVRPRNKDLISATRPVSGVADGIIRQRNGSVPLNAESTENLIPVLLRNGGFHSASKKRLVAVRRWARSARNTPQGLVDEALARGAGGK
jgi:hypothetical protein